MILLQTPAPWDVPKNVPVHQMALTSRRLSQDTPGNVLENQEMYEKVLGTQEAQINRRLPAEMLEKVFRHLPPKDLKAAVLVCKW